MSAIPPTVRPTLEAAFGFTAADLEANRAGRISASQADRIRRQWQRTRTVAIIGLIVIGLAATLFLFFGSQNDQPVLSAIGAGLTLVNAAVVGLSASSYLRGARDLREGVVTTLEGEARRTVNINRRVITYLFQIGGERITVSKDMFNALDEGARYRLYRAPYTRLLLAIDRM